MPTDRAIARAAAPCLQLAAAAGRGPDRRAQQAQAKMAMDRDADDVEAANVASVLADQRVKEALASRPIGSRTCGSSSQYQFDADEFCACRYLVAHNNDADAAAAALAATLRWRQEARPAEIECAACLRDPHSHSLRVCGWDGSGRAVMYTCFSQATHRFNPEENTQHLTRTLEDACAIMASRSHISSRTDFEDASGGTTGAAVKVAGAESCIWVVDFHGYSMYSDSNPRTAVLASELLAHYPQRLHRAVLVDAPRVFSATWAALKMVINSVTASKVVFARTGDGSLEAELESWGPLSHAVRQWLLAEIASNREHTAVRAPNRDSPRFSKQD
eukprot:SAG31_NODE_861_length_11418_cov_5.107430_6_plen_332_part_00